MNRPRLKPTTPVLVALLNSKRDWHIAREQHWYRIPVKNEPPCLQKATHIAFYMTKVFGLEGWAVSYFATIRKCSIVPRKALLPQEPGHVRANELYYKLELGEIQKREPAILSRRGRRVIFICTTRAKFERADEINDLFNDSPLEDLLWDVFKAERIEAERQHYESVGKKFYALDFALYCENGKIDVECDGDTWHADPARIPEDNDRNNDLEKQGWAVLRFNTKQLQEEMPRCLQIVRETINQYGGLKTPEGELRYFALGGTDRAIQYNLFQETVDEYEARKKNL